MKRLEKLVTAVSERRIPSYGRIIPAVYDTEDIPDLVEFTECVKILRTLLKDTVEKWNQTSRFAGHIEGK